MNPIETYIILDSVDDYGVYMAHDIYGIRYKFVYPEELYIGFGYTIRIDEYKRFIDNDGIIVQLVYFEIGQRLESYAGLHLLNGQLIKVEPIEITPPVLREFKKFEELKKLKENLRGGFMGTMEKVKNSIRYKEKLKRMNPDIFIGGEENENK